MIAAALLLASWIPLGSAGAAGNPVFAGAVPQDLEAEATGLTAAGHYLEALAVIDSVADPARAARLRVDALWAAGDLGGALQAGLAGLEQDADPDTRRRLLWGSLSLCLQLGEAGLAQDLIPRLEEAVTSAPDLDQAGRAAWRDGWAPGTGLLAARADASALAGRLEAAEAGVRRAKGVTAVVTLLALVGMVLLARRP
jgi:hypothetical protein